VYRCRGQGGFRRQGLWRGGAARGCESHGWHGLSRTLLHRWRVWGCSVGQLSQGPGPAQVREGFRHGCALGAEGTPLGPRGCTGQLAGPGGKPANSSDVTRGNAPGTWRQLGDSTCEPEHSSSRGSGVGNVGNPCGAALYIDLDPYGRVGGVEVWGEGGTQGVCATQTLSWNSSLTAGMPEGSL